MRWDRLFADLEARLSAEDTRELIAEVADRTRRERALVELTARLLAGLGREVVVRTVAGRRQGRIVDVGADWFVLETGGPARGGTPARRGAPEGARTEAPVGRPVLIPLGAVQLVTGLAQDVEEPSLVARRFALGGALRAISRDRAPVEITLADGTVVTGTIDAVGADHLDLAEHASDEPRRRENVQAHHVLPLAALAAVRRF